MYLFIYFYLPFSELLLQIRNDRHKKTLCSSMNYQLVAIKNDPELSKLSLPRGSFC